jgi:hypothetical protein
MNKSEIALIIITFLALGFSLYRKYGKKDKVNTASGSGIKPGSSFSSTSKDDDYEPYSKK